MPRVIVEYNENSIAWLIDVVTHGRLCVEHGMLVRIEVEAHTCWPVSREEAVSVPVEATP